MNKKKILQIAAYLTIGGAEKVIRDIGLYADPDVYEHHYIVFGNETGTYENELIDRGYKIFHIPSPSSNYLRYYCTIKELIEENHYIAVHAHTMFNIGWVMLAAKRCGVPIRIAHAHSALTIAKPTIKIGIYETVMRKLILDNATDLIACGVDAGNRLFGEKVFHNKGTLILNGIDISAFKYSEEERQKIREILGWEDAFLIGHVGHLAAVKNQSFLLDLMPRILNRKPNARLILLGEGEDRRMLEEKIQRDGLGDVVKMTGNVTNVSDYLSAMDVFAFPSLFEGMPLSIMEVQANGLPCVLSTNVPKDVYLTDLITSLPIAQIDDWINVLCSAGRSEPEKYQEIMAAKELDTRDVMKKIYEIYNR